MVRTSLALAILLPLAGCSDSENVPPCPDDLEGTCPPAGSECPPKGIGVEDYSGLSQTDQIAVYKRFKCTTPQICPDRGGRAVRWVLDPQAPPGEIVFLITNCSTGNEKLEINRVEVWGDSRCYFGNVTDADIASKTINPGETAPFRVTYNPKTVGEDHAELRVFSNATNFSPYLDLLVCGVVEEQQLEPDASVPLTDAGTSPVDAAATTDAGEQRFLCKPATAQAACHKQ